MYAECKDEGNRVQEGIIWAQWSPTVLFPVPRVPESRLCRPDSRAWLVGDRNTQTVRIKVAFDKYGKNSFSGEM